MKSLFSYTITSLFAAMWCLVPAPAAAEDVTVAIEVLVEAMSPEGQYGIEVGAVLTGTYMFDDETPDDTIDPVTGEDQLPDIGYYYHDVPPYGMILTYDNGEETVMFESVEGPASEDSGFEIYVRNTQPGPESEGDRLVFESLGGVLVHKTLLCPSWQDTGGIYWSLFEPLGDAVDSDNLPPAAPALQDWENHTFEIYCLWGDESFAISGTVQFAEVVTQDPVTNLLERLEQLAADDILDGEQEAGLFEKINQVALKIGSNRIFQACQQLEAFICQLEALASQFPDPEDVAELLEWAYQLLADNQCGEQYPENDVECPMVE